MKTTVELPDALVLRAKRAALERSVTLKTLIERGLMRELNDPSEEPKDGLDELMTLDASIWGAVDADRYVQEQREGWE